MTSKSMLVAKADLKMAMKSKHIKYSLVFLAALAPVMLILIIGLPAALIDPASPDYIVVNLFLPLGASMLTLMAVIPAGLIAANALVGERESNTLEPLLCTPLTDRELIWGKTLSSLIPCLTILFAGTLASSIGINILMVAFNRPLLLFPDPAGAFLIFAAGPVVVLSIVSTMILVSGRVSKVYEAYQSGTIAALVLMIPLFAPMTSLETGMADPSTIWFTNIVTFIIASAIASITWAIALKRFNRDKMVSLV